MADSDDDRQSAAALIGSDDDILTEILIRLPVASITRFKSVCKQWRLLLSHTHFTHRYDSLLKSPGIFIDDAVYVPVDDNDNVEHRSTPPFRSLDFYFGRSGVKIEQSCNGLLLCSADDCNHYYVFNPTTKQLAIIPSVPEHSYALALAFHQTHCVHYKVVCIREVDHERDLYQIQVYSSDTRTWRICVKYFGIESGQGWHPYFRYPVYWNGAVLWVPGYEESAFLHFKLDDEELEVLPGPDGLGSDKTLLYFGESRGHLHLVCEERELRVNVYEMLRDRSGWFVKYQLPLYSLVGDFSVMGPNGRCILEVVDVVIGKAEEDTFLVLLSHSKMLRYNVHDKSFKELHEECFKVPWYYHRYIETLSSF